MRVSWPAPAWQGGPHGRGPGFGIERHAERLGLDEARLADIRAVSDEFRPAKLELHERMKEARRTLHDLLNQELPDEGAVMAQADRISALQGEQLRLRLAMTLQVRSMLSSEQRAELVQIFEERAEAREERRAERRALVEAACAPELESLCAGAEPGPERGMCLRQSDEQLSTGCRAALESRRGRRGGWGHKGDF